MAFCVESDPNTGYLYLVEGVVPSGGCQLFMQSTEEFDQAIAAVGTESPPTPGAINAETILYDFSWGLGAVLLFWSLGAAVGAATKAISKI